ncbi:MAG TPA: hypothetical protein VNT26_10370 [Candidatus Sulfotelmatobacter sp.]|nr:hypothetical protein [Candidatus Sulfotelmatobacter sp.]HWI60176.1 hypothetical protein [Bacillota bacterium]
MRATLIPTARLIWFSMALLGFGCLGLSAQAADLKLEAQLVWGTDAAQSPDPKHKPVEADIRKKLKELPLKWANYFEVNRKSLDLPPKGLKKVNLSEKCDLEVQILDNSKLQVSLFGKGEQVVKRTQALPKGEMLVLGGNAPNDTAWLVIVKRIE